MFLIERLVRVSPAGANRQLNGEDTRIRLTSQQEHGIGNIMIGNNQAILVYCTMGNCFVDMIFRDGLDPICFLGHGANTCSEPDDTFVMLSECESNLILAGTK